MIRGLAMLLVCQLLGEAAVRAAGLPLPGPVLGLVLLLAVFAVLRGRGVGGGRAETTLDDTEAAGDRILSVLGLLFVPAGVGVVTELDLFARHGIALAVVLAVSVVATLLVTVFTFLAVRRLLPATASDPAAPEPGDG
jgi:holin-like protein